MANPAAPKERLDPQRLGLLLCTRPFDRSAWEADCSEHLHLRLGNQAPVVRRDQALARLEQLMNATLSFGSGFCDVWSRRESIYVETDIQIRRLSDELDSIPCFIIARTTHRLLQDLRFYFDPTPIALDARLQ